MALEISFLIEGKLIPFPVLRCLLLGKRCLVRREGLSAFWKVDDQELPSYFRELASLETYSGLHIWGAFVQKGLWFWCIWLQRTCNSTHFFKVADRVGKSLSQLKNFSGVIVGGALKKYACDNSKCIANSLNLPQLCFAVAVFTIQHFFLFKKKQVSVSGAMTVTFLFFLLANAFKTLKMMSPFQRRRKDGRSFSLGVNNKKPLTQNWPFEYHQLVPHLQL